MWSEAGLRTGVADRLCSRPQRLLRLNRAPFALVVLGQWWKGMQTLPLVAVRSCLLRLALPCSCDFPSC